MINVGKNFVITLSNGDTQTFSARKRVW